MSVRSQLILVDGTAGLWKEDLVEYIDRMHGLHLVKKFSTRGPRGDEDLARTDLQHVDQATLDALKTPYSYSTLAIATA